MKKLSGTNINLKQIKIARKYIQIICAVVIVICIALYALMGYMWNDEQGKQDDLEIELRDVIDQYNIYSSGTETKDWSVLMEEHQEALAYERSVFPEDLNANEIMQILLQAADESGVNILPLSGIKGGKTETINGNEYYKVDFGLSPRGTLPAVLDFVERLETGNIGGQKYTTIVVESVSFTGKGSSWSANIQASIYSR